MINRRPNLTLLCFILIITAILFVSLNLKHNQPDKASIIEKELLGTQKLTKNPFELKDISDDPRFKNENYIKFFSVYDIAPCLSFSGSDSNSCVSGTFQKIIRPGIEIVVNIHSSHLDGRVFSVIFKDRNGIITTFPDISDAYSPSIAFVNESSILLAFDCDECTTTYTIFDGVSWKNMWGFEGYAPVKGVINTHIPTGTLFFSKENPPYEIMISDQFIKVEETGYNFSDALNQLRFENLGAYSFLLDRKTYKLLIIGVRKSPDYKFSEIGKAISDYLNFLLDHPEINFQKEIASWNNFIEYEENKIPYPANWIAETYYLDDNNTGVLFKPSLGSGTPASGRYISLNLSKRCTDCYLEIKIGKSKGVDFEMLKMINIIQSGLKEHLKPQNK